MHSVSVCYIVHTLHMLLVSEPHWKLAGLLLVFFFSLLLSSVGITACPGLFVSIAYHGGGSLAVMLRVWLSPLCCIRQQWDWVVCFISTHPAYTQRPRELFSCGADWKGLLIFGRWISFVCSSLLICAPDFEGHHRADCFPCLTSFGFGFIFISEGYFLRELVCYRDKMPFNSLKMSLDVV